MPLHVYDITRPVTWTDFRGGRRKFEISANAPLDHGRLFYTWDALKASLCEQAHRQGRPIELGTRQTKYGFELVTARLNVEAA